jgi:O-antigen ligase
VDSKTGFSIELDLFNLFRKIGLAGLAMYLLAFFLPLRIAWQQWRQSDRCPEAVAFFAISLVAVFGMGAVNPYATASLGIGAMCIALAQLASSARNSPEDANVKPTIKW